MNIEDFRSHCLSLPSVEETMPWATGKNRRNQGFLCFSVGGKWFSIVHVDEFEFCLLKCPPELAEELRLRYEGVRPGWHMNKRHWNSVYFGSDVTDGELRRQIRLAYDTVVGSLPRRVREELAPRP